MAGMETTLTDRDGRRLEVRRISRREAMRLTRLWGIACNVEIWVGNALLAANVRAIDGVPVPAAATPDQIEALVDQLGDAGLAAVAEWLGALPQPDRAAELAAAKN